MTIDFEPKAHAGGESNSVLTKAGSGFEVLFRLYALEKLLFDKTRVLPDIENVPGIQRCQLTTPCS
jgi:hypothetical protein